MSPWCFDRELEVAYMPHLPLFDLLPTEVAAFLMPRALGNESTPACKIPQLYTLDGTGPS